jgi:tetratricopeptide (TPR) repeat protein
MAYPPVERRTRTARPLCLEPVLEETPSPDVAAKMRRGLGHKAWTIATLISLPLLVLAGFRIRERPIDRDRRAARRALTAGRFAEARAPIEHWLQARPQSAEAHFLKARVALALEGPREVITSLERATALGHPELEVALLRAMLDSKLGRHGEAEPILRLSFESSLEPDAQRDEALARVYLETYDLQRAVVVLDRWALDAPNDPRPYLWRTEVDSRVNGNPSLIIADYREALRRDSNLAEAYLGLADELRKLHQNTRAAAEYATYLALKPDDPAGHVGAGRNLAELADDAAAIRHFERALVLDPKNPAANREYAEVDLRRGDLMNALVHLDRAIQLDPFDVATRHSRIFTLTRLGRIDEAGAEQAASKRLRADLDYLNRIRSNLVDSPHDRRLQIRIARWMFEHGHGEEGVRWAEKVLREQPGHPEASRLLLDYYQGRGETGLANYYRMHAASK